MVTIYKPGAKIHILPYEKMGFKDHVNSCGAMEPWYDTIATVRSIDNNYQCTLHIEEDNGEWYWHYKNIEPVSNVVFATIDNEALLCFL